MPTPRQEIKKGERIREQPNACYPYLETVQAIAQAILEAPDITLILDELLEKTMAVGGFDVGNIRVFNTAGNIVSAAYRGYRDPEKARLRHHQIENMEKNLALREVVKSGRVMVIENTLRENRMKGFKEEGARSAVAVPLAARGEVYGVIALATRSRRQFQPAEVRLIEKIGAEIGMGVQKSRLLEETQKQAEKLKEANKLHADFSAMIAHDLRSPLYTIIGIAEMMKDGLFGALNDDQKNWLDRVKNNAAGLVNLVSDFLDVSKLESGRLELSRAEIDITGLVQNTLQNFAPLAKSKNITLTCEADRSTFPIRADGRRLDQVLTNLVSNAVKFTGHGGTIKVRVRSHTDEGVQVEVQDTGTGIPPNEIENLFHKYRQVKSLTVPVEQGTGLGLVICKMIVEAHGGEIWADSEEGKGATFAFTLPCNPCAGQEEDDGFLAPNR